MGSAQEGEGGGLEAGAGLRGPVGRGVLGRGKAHSGGWLWLGQLSASRRQGAVARQPSPPSGEEAPWRSGGAGAGAAARIPPDPTAGRRVAEAVGSRLRRFSGRATLPWRRGYSSRRRRPAW